MVHGTDRLHPTVTIQFSQRLPEVPLRSPGSPVELARSGCWEQCIQLLEAARTISVGVFPGVSIGPWDIGDGCIACICIVYIAIYNIYIYIYTHDMSY